MNKGNMGQAMACLFNLIPGILLQRRYIASPLPDGNRSTPLQRTPWLGSHNFKKAVGLVQENNPLHETSGFPEV